MNNETKELPVPSLNPDQVLDLMNYVNTKVPTMYGKEILAYIEKVAIELDRQKSETTAVEEVKTTE